MLGIVRIALTLFSGLGIGAVLDKVAADKLPVSTTPLKIEGGFVKNAVILVVLSTIGTFIVRYLLKTLKLNRTIKL